MSSEDSSSMSMSSSARDSSDQLAIISALIGQLAAAYDAKQDELKKQVLTTVVARLAQTSVMRALKLPALRERPPLLDEVLVHIQLELKAEMAALQKTTKKPPVVTGAEGGGGDGYGFAPRPLYRLKIRPFVGMKRLAAKLALFDGGSEVTTISSKVVAEWGLLDKFDTTKKKMILEGTGGEKDFLVTSGHLAKLVVVDDRDRPFTLYNVLMVDGEDEQLFVGLNTMEDDWMKAEFAIQAFIIRPQHLPHEEERQLFRKSKGTMEFRVSFPRNDAVASSSSTAASSRHRHCRRLLATNATKVGGKEEEEEKPMITAGSSSPRPVPPPLTSWQRALIERFDAQLTGDCAVLVADGETGVETAIRATETLLAFASPVLADMFDQLLQGAQQGGTVIRLTETNYGFTHHYHMIKYCCTRVLEDGMDPGVLFELAIRYEICTLQRQCSERLVADAAAVTPGNAVKVLLMADKVGDVTLKAATTAVIVANLHEVKRSADYAILDDQPHLVKHLMGEFRRKFPCGEEEDKEEIVAVKAVIPGTKTALDGGEGEAAAE